MICNTVICNQLRLQVLDVRKQFFSPEWSDVRSVGMNTVLCLVVDGSAYVNVGKKSYRAKKGDLYLLPETKQSSFGCDSADGLTLWYVHLKTEMPSGSLFDWIACSDWCISLTKNEQKECEEYFEQMKILPSELHPFKQQFAVHRTLYSLLYFFLLHVDVTETTQKDWLGNTLQYISENLHGNLSVDALASRVALHPNYFIRSFHARLGIAPARYVAELRCQHAKMLMDMGRRDMHQIGKAIGMEETASFYTFFKRHMYMTPYQYLETKEREEKQ